MADATPRINASYLESFANRNVRLVGKVKELRGDTATLDAGGLVTVILNRKLMYERQDCHLQVGRAFEIIGKVTNELSVKVMATTDLGDNIDYNAAEAVVDATHRYKDIFYE
ncbi:MAG: hypothetical protein Q9162_004165 [Coniocarpon cinnabarinum]